VLVWDLGMLWQLVRSVGGLLDAAGENFRYLRYTGTSGEGVQCYIRFVYVIYTVYMVYIRL
jgi:hypothetical protein